MSPPQEPEPFIQRGVYHTDLAGSAVYCGLRALDPFLQQRLLQSLPNFLVSRVGLRASTVQPLAIFETGPVPQPFKLLTDLGVKLNLNLTPAQTVVWAMSVGVSLKHIFWRLFIGNEPITPKVATIVAVFNAAFSTLNTLNLTLAAANPTYSIPSSLYVGSALFAVGILAEPIAEIQRKRFKDNPANKGKPYSGGLFGVVRNPNYAAYTIYRTGYALASGGWVWAAATAGFFIYNFVTDAIPELEAYCRKRYGEDWKVVEKQVPYRLFPGIY